MLPEGQSWLYEVKFDGYRILSMVAGSTVRCFTRNWNDWTAKFTAIARDLRMRGVQNAWFDGEIVVFDSKGRSDFGALQAALGGELDQPLHYVLFDLLYLNGTDLRAEPLLKRKELLRQLLPKRSTYLFYSDHVVGNGVKFLNEACKNRLEGVIAKQKDHAHSPGRSAEWIKVKCVNQDEFIICGYIERSDDPLAVGALLLGRSTRAGLEYVGKVGTGFTSKTARELLGALRGIKSSSPFAHTAPKLRNVTWVRPIVLAEVRYSELTADGKLRAPSFLGVRKDKSAEDVRREASMTARKRQKSIAGVEITHPDRVIDEESGITKYELAEYYDWISEDIMPHLAKRPLVLLRCPENANACFFQKHPGPGIGEDVPTIEIRESRKIGKYSVVKKAKDLLNLVQSNVVEFHVWGSSSDKVERPDRVVFDLDPASDMPWKRTAGIASQMRLALQQLGLESFVKTTGGKGLHIVIPIVRTHSWEEVYEFSRDFAELFSLANLDEVTDNVRKAARKGKVFLDYLRNSRGATSVCAYSARARHRTSISMPVEWEEIGTIRPDQFNILNIRREIRRNAWDGFFEVKQNLKGARSALRNARR